MNPQDIGGHKKAQKNLIERPEFKPMKRGKLPKPFKTMGGSRLFSTGLIDVSDSHCIIFLWRDGEVIEDSSFMAWFFCKLQNGDLSPLFEMHLHPSHKGLHGKTPCKTDLTYTNRQLPGAPEFNLDAKCRKEVLDPRDEDDRDILINRFCQICGITIGARNNLWN